MPPDAARGEFAIEWASIGPAADRRSEPGLFAEPPVPEPAPSTAVADEPQLIGFGEASLALRIEEEEAAPAPVRRGRPFGLLGSLGLHLLPLLLLLDWPAARPAAPPAIPVRLVIEKPPPAPPPPAVKEPPKPGRLASDNMGEPTHSAGVPRARTTAPDERQVALAPPPRLEAMPSPRLFAHPPPPLPRPSPPAPVRVLQPPTLRHAAVQPPAPARRPLRVPGPDATRSEYLAYLRTITRRHLYMLPRSFLGDRRGETILLIRVLDDGTIARISVRRSSGYRDIDARIEHIIATIGRFPPLPQFFQGPSVELDLRLRFPEALYDP